MKAKIICIIVMTLLITTALPCISGSLINNDNFNVTENQELKTMDFTLRIRENKANSNPEYEYITRDKIIEIAEAYANYEWYPTTDNIFHDVCPYCGERVETVDRDSNPGWPDYWGWKAGQLNIGVPYKIGGFSSISGYDLINPEDFYEQYTGTGNYSGEIHYGGDIYFNKPEPCSWACGIDCSGLVSRCWNLPEKHYTATLPDVSSPVKFDELKPGDLINAPNYHSILFKEFVDEDTIIVIDSGGVAWQVAEFTCNITYISDDAFNIRLVGYYYDYTEYFGNRLFSTRQYNFISGTPSAPIIDGQTSGTTGVEYEYTFNAVDPDGDNVKFYIEWDDGNFEETDYFPSGTDVKVKHTWSEDGDYSIIAKAENINGIVGPWGILTVTMPRDKTTNNVLLLRLLERFPLLQKLIQQQWFGL